MRIAGRIRKLEKKVIPSGPHIIAAHSEEEAEKKKREALKENPDRELIVIITPEISKYRNVTQGSAVSKESTKEKTNE